jgi:mannosyl-3-phosphoglycerate phosphatase
MRWVLFTDLDGTLLDHDTYSFAPALPALAELRRRGAAVVLCTSKTRAEILRLRAEIGLTGPFITENGAGVFVPAGYFPQPVPGAEVREGFEVLTLGAPYADLLADLHAAAAETGVPVRGFSQMSVEELAQRTGLPLEVAALSARREFVEPFAVEQGADPAPLLAAIERRGRSWTRGGRFFHILGGSDKGQAVARLQALFRLEGPCRTAGLGDAENDAVFLRVTDLAVVVRGKRSPQLASLLPNARHTELPGPSGWNQAVLELLADGESSPSGNS